MCLIVVGIGLRPDVPLLLAANRDEFFARPTRAADFWPDAGDVLAGRDLEQGGTWLGLTRSGRIAALTNYREGGRPRTGTRSRGWLVRDFLMSDAEPGPYLGQVQDAGERYDGFNLLLGSRAALHYYSNRGAEPIALSSGVYGLSNHLLDSPWPKVERAKARIADLTDAPREALDQRLFELLADDRRAPDDELPQTGVSLEWERVLSSAFIRTDAYGTRSSTVILIGADGRMLFEERSFTSDGSQAQRQRFELQQ
jgi:uncharacterized protein with NRDE domain